MIFTVGNIITVLVVIVVLVVYRQLDSNNRSLEKVKRFADKVRKDLDGFVESKVDELKNLSIDLDVHQKTGKEILKRISTIEDNLKNRAGDIDQLHQRIVEYDQALGDLVDMTGKVDENLKRLHDESEFVDSVGKRLREAVTRMAHLEKTIPALKEDFAAQNEEYLRGLADQVLQGADDKVREILAQVESSDGRVTEFAEYLTRLEARRDDLEHNTFQALRDGLAELEAEAGKARASMAAEFEDSLQELVAREEINGRSLIEDLERMHDGLKNEVETTQNRLSEKLELFQDRVNSIEDEYQSALREAEERGHSLEDEIFIKLKERVEGRARSVENNLAAVLGETKEKIENSRKELVQVFGDTRSEITVWQAKLNKAMEDSVAELDGKFRTFTEGLETRMTSVLDRNGKTQEARERELATFIDETRETIVQLENGIRERVDVLASTITEKEKEFRLTIDETGKRTRELADSVSVELDGRIGEFEQTLSRRFGAVESKVSDFEADVSYRYRKVEGVSKDVDLLEKNLRKAMDLVIGRIHADLNDFEAQLAAGRKQEKIRADRELEEIRQSMAVIENELVELKSKAYENVSEKLQVFEDEFFSDLKVRNETMTGKLENWQREMSHRLDDIAVAAEGKRQEIEHSYSENLKVKLTELQSKIFGQYERFETQVNGFQDRITQRMTTSENAMQGFEDTLLGQFEEARDASQETMGRLFKEYSASIDGKVHQYEHDIDSTLKTLREEVVLGRKELTTMLESSRGDVTVWQAKVLQQLKESEVTVNEEVNGFKSALTETIEILKDDFATQRDTLIRESEGERDVLRRDISALGESVARVEADLTERAREALDSFSRQYHQYVEDFSDRSKRLTGEIDDKMKDFRGAAAETRERVDQLQARLFGKIEDTTKTLAVTINEIDKRQKDFISQTKIFDRADSLKAGLEESLGELKAEIDRVDGQSKDIKEAEKKFVQVRKLGDDVSQKMTQFLAEKRRIEAMEQDFKKLITISQAVDMKLEQVTSSSDTLQEIQARIRELEEIEEETLQKYERIEMKQHILDTTTEGVDKNFAALENLEKEIKSVENQLASLPNQIDRLQKRIEGLSANKEKADKAADQIAKLEPILVDLEERLDSMQKAREWLARTETRLEDINRQAQEQVKLLGTLLKDGNQSRKREKGAPPMGVREMVTRLANQGWSVQQISQATKLSVGEVELILELLPKK